MLNLGIQFTPQAPLRLLCLGAHSDDIEIGCGGTMATLLARYPHVHVRWVVFSANQVRESEARASAAAFLQPAQEAEVIVHHFRDGFFPDDHAAIKEQFETLKRRFTPDVVFTHYRDDRHQDHRVVSDLTWNTFRNHLVLEYEIPKYDGDLGQPNVFVPIEESICQLKVERLLSCFASQREKPWFDEQTFRALMRLRGMEANSPTKMAEAFYGRKLCLS
jgi:LmbE family N-acetylglucosaminyl deacetylase